MAIKNSFHLFLPLQLHIGIIFTLKRRYFQFDSIQIIIYIIMSPKDIEMSPLAELAPSSIPKVPDVDQPRNTSKDQLHVSNGPMTRSKTKALKKALNALVLNVSTKSKLKGPLEYQEETLVHLIHVQEGSNTTLFGP